MTPMVVYAQAQRSVHWKRPRGCVNTWLHQGRRGRLVHHVQSGDSPCTLLNETAKRRLIRLILPQPLKFTGDEIMWLVQPGLYANTRALRKTRRKG